MARDTSLGAIVLSGGRSSRMGRDKAQLPFGGETLLGRVVRIVCSAVPHVVLAAGSGQPAPLPCAGLHLQRDPEAQRGPLPALLRAAASIGTELVFVAACDTPLLQPCVIRLLADACEGWDAAVPVIGGRRMATCAVYRTAALKARAERFGDPRDGSLQAFIAPLRVRELTPTMLRDCDPDLLSFTPCNTPDEYRRTLALAGIPVNDGVPPAV